MTVGCWVAARRKSKFISLLLPHLLAAVWLGPLSGNLLGQDTPDYFQANCASCHTIGGGNLAGPDLKNLSARQGDREWLINFMQDPRGVIESGDAYAVKLLEDAGGKVYMPTGPGMNRERAEKLLDLIDAESKLEKSRFQGKASTEPFTPENRVNGQKLFVGREPLTKEGTACIACHSIHGAPLLGGGQLGPDLTAVYERLKGRKALSAWLTAPSTETMQPIFRKHPLTPEEVHDLTAYFESLAGESPPPPAAQRVTFLVMGLLGGAFLVFVCDAIWKRRFRAVRGPLVQATNSRGQQ